jgi:hypothetical protein
VIPVCFPGLDLQKIDKWRKAELLVRSIEIDHDDRFNMLADVIEENGDKVGHFELVFSGFPYWLQ